MIQRVVQRGILQRGQIFYIRFTDQHGKRVTERVGPSLKIARVLDRCRRHREDA